jgi:large subunit ribosomal protein L22
MVNVNAQLNYLRISPRKVRLLADLVRGVPLEEAKLRLNFNKKKSTIPLLKLLKSVESNARHNYQLEPEALFIKEIRVDGGPFLKRYMPRARGRATMIKKRTSHVTIVLAEINKPKAKLKPKSKGKETPKTKVKEKPEVKKDKIIKKDNKQQKDK